MVTPTPPSNSTFRWSCNGCSIDGKNEQSIYISEVDFSLRGEINCSVIVGYETYTSIPIRLGVIGEYYIHTVCNLPQNVMDMNMSHELK